MVTIRRISVIFLCLVVITSLSFTAFAAGEQPSGSSYWYVSGTGTTLYGTYWESVSKSLFYMGQDINTILSNLPSGSSYSYYNGSSRYSNFWTALTSGLAYIGLEAYTIQGDTASIRSSNSDIKSYTSDIKSSLPTTSTYSYTTNTGTTNTTTYWNASNNQLGYIHSRLGSVLDKITSLDNKFIDYSTILHSIDTNIDLVETNTSSIDSATSSIDSKIPSRTFGSISANGSGVTMGYNWFEAVAVDMYNSFPQLFQINSRILTVRNYLADLHTMFASPEDLALKADQNNNVTSATSNFLSGNDSATSIGTGSIGSIKQLGDGISSWFDTGVSATSLFTVLSNDANDGPWAWFTQDCADSLDSTNNNRNHQKSTNSGDYVPDFYGAKMSDLNKLLGSLAPVDTKRSDNYVYTAADFQPVEQEDEYVD